MSNEVTSLAYNDTLTNRCTVLALIASLQNIKCCRSPTSSNIIYLSPRHIVKFGRTVHLAEASALRLVKASTSIPVPKVHCAFRDEKSGVSYIVMERIDGEMLGKKLGQMSERDREGIWGQLKDMWGELRGIANLRPGAVCAADGGTLHDPRIWGAAKGMGPFNTEGEFNLFLRNGIESTENIEEGEKKRDVERLIKMHREHEARHLKTVFTHSDVSASNILVKAGKVVGLIDFEMAGFYPEYWEYTTAMNSNYIKGWREEIAKFLTPYPSELDMDTLWRTNFCDGP
jgi:serine/threonine protein kinase